MPLTQPILREKLLVLHAWVQAKILLNALTTQAEKKKKKKGVTGLRKQLRCNRPSIGGTQPAREGA